MREQTEIDKGTFVLAPDAIDLKEVTGAPMTHALTDALERVLAQISESPGDGRMIRETVKSIDRLIPAYAQIVDNLQLLRLSLLMSVDHTCEEELELLLASPLLPDHVFRYPEMDLRAAFVDLASAGRLGGASGGRFVVWAKQLGRDAFKLSRRKPPSGSDARRWQAYPLKQKTEA